MLREQSVSVSLLSLNASTFIVVKVWKMKVSMGKRKKVSNMKLLADFFLNKSQICISDVATAFDCFSDLTLKQDLH